MILRYRSVWSLLILQMFLIKVTLPFSNDTFSSLSEAALMPSLIRIVTDLIFLRFAPEKSLLIAELLAVKCDNYTQLRMIVTV